MSARGFTLLETLVAVSILSLALAGILSLSAIGIHSSSNSANQIKAFFLASEAVEYVRNKRDNNILAGSGWLSGLSGCEAGCSIDAFNDTISVCAGVCPKIKFNSATNLYGYTSGTDSIFTRKLTITQSVAYEIKLSSEISWQQGGISRNFVLEERLFDLSF
ncbi:MAG: prepilin-type N-terminal cleavage/methylation domain-containing protein [Patescibacteria group bacterium]